MFLGIIAALALTVGTIEATNHMAEAESVKQQMREAAVVHAAQPQQQPEFVVHDFDL